MDCKKISSYTESHRPLIKEAFDYLLTHPACGYREWEASRYLEEQYRKLGYTPILAEDIPGFYIDIDTGKEGPKIALFSELDALPCPEHPYADKETGAAHACGHHAQGATLLGVAAVLKEEGVLDGLCGSIRLLVVPAEELVELDFRAELKRKGIIGYFGGKQEFLRRGYLDGVDMAFMIHTGGGIDRFTMWRGCNGCIIKKAEFKGKASHAGGSPSRGINAMYAASLSLNAINSMRETFRDSDHVRVHPIIINAGKAVNIIPETALIENQVRASSVDVCTKVNRKVNRATAASAAAMGAKVTISDTPGYLPGKYDGTLTKYAIEAMREVVGEGEGRIRYLVDQWDGGCTDMGDISSVMPALHAFGSGVTGTGHGKDYFVTHFDSACINSANAQILFIRNMLKNNAQKARDVLSKFTPTFPSYKEYLDYLDSIFVSYEGVEYLEDGTAKLNY